MRQKVEVLFILIVSKGSMMIASTGIKIAVIHPVAAGVCGSLTALEASAK